MSPLSSEATRALQKGLDYCRRSEWDMGLLLLGRLAEGPERGAMPGVFYSYLGYGIARCEQRMSEGMKLCRHAVKIEFYQPDNYLNLARTALLANDRKAAIEAVRAGLAIDPHYLDLLSLARELGVRRPPVLAFLSRNNPLNRLLGAVRHRLKR